ncbi:MAG: hypothetical protein LBS27_04350 [Bifidobacteriaceae bacterium]|jgi:hypothetical protein|nr:hypothetical protein [Bifidobacteriaceae bacterium]
MIAVFEKLKADDSASRLRPATDAQARVALADDEPTDAPAQRLRWVNAAFQTRAKPGQWVGMFTDLPSESQQQAAEWEVSFTPSRLIVWSPLAVGLMGKMKPKAGAASGGHVLYKWIDEFTLGRTNTGYPGITFIFEANPKDTRYRLQLAELNFWNREDAVQTSALLADRIGAYWRGQGVDTPELQAELDKLRNHDWSGPEEALGMLGTGVEVKYMPPV